MLAGVVGAVQAAALGVLDQSPDALGVRRRDLHADLAHDALGQSALELAPGIATIGGAVHAALGAAGEQRPGFALAAPGAGVQDTGVGRVHRQVDHAGALVQIQDLLPGVAAVARAEDTPFGVRAEGVAERGDPGGVGIARVHQDLADLAGVAQADEAPGAAAVGGAVGAHARGNVAADARRAGAEVDHVRVGGRHRHGADAAGIDLAVGEVHPALAGVGAAPQAAAGAAEVEGVRLAWHAGGGGGTAAAVGPDHAVVQALQQGGVDQDVRVVAAGRRRRGARDSDRRQQHEQRQQQCRREIQGRADREATRAGHRCYSVRGSARPAARGFVGRGRADATRPRWSLSIAVGRRGQPGGSRSREGREEGTPPPRQHDPRSAARGLTRSPRHAAWRRRRAPARPPARPAAPGRR